jgi:beta-lactam-binding protein with PASTA domain
MRVLDFAVGLHASGLIEERRSGLVGLGRRALLALGKVGIVLAVLIAFLFGMLGTVYLSLRTAEVKVPDVLGKDRFAAEKMLEDAGLKIRVRGARPSTDKKPDTILSQLPEAGLTVKTGIEIAVEVSRAPKEGEHVSTSTDEPAQEAEKPADNANQATSATNQNQNQNQNQNKPPKNKNSNKNANNKNANNSNNNNANNRNTGATNRNTNNGNRNANPNTNRPAINSNRPANLNSNANRRPPVISTPPFNPGANRGTP